MVRAARTCKACVPPPHAHILFTVALPPERFRAYKRAAQTTSSSAHAGVLLRSVDRQTEILAADGYNAKATDVVRRVYALAATCWRQPGHPGWALYHHDFAPATKLTVAPHRQTGMSLRAR